MSKNIFNKTYFGKPYKTKDGRKAILTHHFGCYVTLAVERYRGSLHSGEFDFSLDGIPYHKRYDDISDLTIIGEWIDENKNN